MKTIRYLHSGKLPLYQKQKCFNNWIHKIKTVKPICFNTFKNCISTCEKPTCQSYSQFVLILLKIHQEINVFQLVRNPPFSHLYASTYYKIYFPSNFLRTENYGSTMNNTHRVHIEEPPLSQ